MYEALMSCILTVIETESPLLSLTLTLKVAVAKLGYYLTSGITTKAFESRGFPFCSFVCGTAILLATIKPLAFSIVVIVIPVERNNQLHYPTLHRNLW